MWKVCRTVSSKLSRVWKDRRTVSSELSRVWKVRRTVPSELSRVWTVFRTVSSELPRVWTVCMTVSFLRSAYANIKKLLPLLGVCLVVVGVISLFMCLWLLFRLACNVLKSRVLPPPRALRARFGG